VVLVDLSMLGLNQSAENVSKAEILRKQGSDGALREPQRNMLVLTQISSAAVRAGLIGVR
jgi:hypothetical protein